MHLHIKVSFLVMNGTFHQTYLQMQLEHSWRIKKNYDGRLALHNNDKIFFSVLPLVYLHPVERGCYRESLLVDANSRSDNKKE